MTLISQAILAQAVTTVDGLGMNERVALTDEIFLHQPNLLAPIQQVKNLAFQGGSGGYGAHLASACMNAC